MENTAPTSSPHNAPDSRISLRESILKHGKSLLMILLPVILTLGIEYWSGLFLPRTVDSPALNPSFTILVLYSGLCAGWVATLAGCLRSWLFPQQLFREEFGLRLLIAWALFGILSACTWRTGLTPATALDTWNNLVLKHSLPPITGDSRDLMLLLLSWVLLSIGAHWLHSHWRGMRSAQQHDREVQGDRLGFLSEGLTYARQIAVRGPVLRPAPQIVEPAFRRRNEPSLDMRPWRDLAFDLVSIWTSSYHFNDTNWHDREGCWCGENVDTGALVLLYPVLMWPNETDLKQFAAYAAQLSTRHTSQQAEILVVHQGTAKVPPRCMLGDQITCVFLAEDTLLDQLIDFAEYRAQIARLVADNSHTMPPGSPVSISQVYVPTGFTNYRTRERGEDVEAHLRAWLADSRPRPMALLGHYGQGKSSTTLMLTHHLLQQPRPARVPILIELRGKSPGDLSPRELLGAWIGTRRNSRMTPDALHYLHQAGRLLLIFEGFDEMANLGGREQRMRHFETLGYFAAYPRSKVLITGRPNLFESSDELEQALGIDQPFGGDGEGVELAYFTYDQIERSLHPYGPTVCKQIVDFARDNQQFYDLVCRPSLLHIVANIWEQEQLASQVDSLTSARVMELFIKRSYERQRLKDQPRRYMFLNSSERAFFMSGVAAYMATNNLPNQIPGVRLNQAVDTLLETIPAEISTQVSPYQGEVRSALSVRMTDTPDALDLLRTDVRTYGLLQDDPSRPGSYRFGHKAFMEYLFAEVIYQSMQGPGQRSPRAAAIMRATPLRLSALAQMPVSCAFLAELFRGHISRQSQEQDAQHSAPPARAEQMARQVWGMLLRLLPGARSLLGKLSLVLTLINATMFQTVPQRLVIAAFISTSFIFIASLTGKILGVFTPPQNLTDPSILYLVSITILSAVLASATKFLFRSRQMEDSNRAVPSEFESFFIVWTYICRELGVDDETLKRVCGIRFLPWIKGTKFDYFPPPREQSSAGGGRQRQPPEAAPKP